MIVAFTEFQSLNILTSSISRKPRAVIYISAECFYYAGTPTSNGHFPSNG